MFTNAGGIPWGSQSSPNTTDLRAVTFSSATHGWAVGANGTIINTINGGNAWTAQNSGVSVSLNGVKFIDNVKGWAVGENGATLRTATGGN